MQLETIIRCGGQSISVRAEPYATIDGHRVLVGISHAHSEEIGDARFQIDDEQRRALIAALQSIPYAADA